jgi:ribosomal-protein-alanine N-acetyltransferase
MQLVPIPDTGDMASLIPGLPPLGADVAAAHRSLYESGGFEPPWIGYFAVEHGLPVGACGFKGPPEEHQVELAYFTFPGHEGRGVGTRMARELVSLARHADPAIIIVAQTEAEEGPSTAILRKLGFRLVGTVHHAEDGEAWEWELPAL